MGRKREAREATERERKKVVRKGKAGKMWERKGVGGRKVRYSTGRERKRYGTL